jgi:hypothetical protein
MIIQHKKSINDGDLPDIFQIKYKCSVPKQLIFANSQKAL